MINPYLKYIGKDEEVCTKCSGYGEIVTYITYNKKKTSLSSLKKCTRCNGYGKLDWCRRLVLGYGKSKGKS